MGYLELLLLLSPLVDDIDNDDGIVTRLITALYEDAALCSCWSYGDESPKRGDRTALFVLDGGANADATSDGDVDDNARNAETITIIVVVHGRLEFSLLFRPEVLL